MNNNEEDNILDEYIAPVEPIVESSNVIDDGNLYPDLDAEVADLAKKIEALDLADDEEYEEDFGDEDEFEDEEIDLEEDEVDQSVDDMKAKFALNPWKGFIQGVRAAFKVWDGFQFAISQDYRNKQKAADFVDIVIERFQQYTTKVKAEDCAEDLSAFLLEEMHTVIEDGSAEWLGNLLVKMFYDVMVVGDFDGLEITINAAAARQSSSYDVIGSASENDDDDDDEDDDDEGDDGNMPLTKAGGMEETPVEDPMAGLVASGRNVLTEANEDGWQTVVANPRRKKWGKNNA